MRRNVLFSVTIKFLGFTITDHGILPDDDKIEAIKHYNAPTNVKEVRQFIGLASYYRKFIKNFSTIAGIITDLTKDAVSWNWTPYHQSAFEKIKLLLISAPILQLPAFDKHFELHVDACDTGIGGVIMQEGKPILFESRKLNEAEKRYPTHEGTSCTGTHAEEMESVFNGKQGTSINRQCIAYMVNDAKTT